MYEKALKFMEENLSLIEDNKWEELYYIVQSDETLTYEVWPDVIKICYDKEINIDMLKDMTSVPPNYFAGNKNLPSEMILPDTIKSIESYAFYGTNIEKIILPEGCTDIYDYAFANCHNLKNIILPDSIKRIDYSAFTDSNNIILNASKNCPNLKMLKALADWWKMELKLN